jgi:hypothetical protein
MNPIDISAVIDGKEEPCIYWKSIQKIIPCLAAMARESSIPVQYTSGLALVSPMSTEGAFSLGKLILGQS